MISIVKDFRVKMRLKKYFQIDPLKSFIELPVLWIVVTLLFAVAIFIAIIIILNSNLTWSADYHGFNSFVEIFKVPLSILAIIITYSAFLATIHRSSQTREQILITNKQNTFSNYFKHIDEFEKYINTTFKHKVISFKNIRATHNYLFPKAFEGDYSINKDFLVVIENEYDEIKEPLEKFTSEGEKSIFNIFYNSYASVNNIFSLLSIKIEHSGGRQIIQDGKKLIIPNSDLAGAFSVILNDAVFLKLILLFDRNISFPNSYNQILEMDLSVIPDWSFETNKKIERFDVFACNRIKKS